jgi:hypothetical protein
MTRLRVPNLSLLASLVFPNELLSLRFAQFLVLMPPLNVKLFCEHWKIFAYDWKVGATNNEE